MKNFKVAFAVLAVIFAVSSAFTVKKANNIKLIDSVQWFDYTGTNPLDEASYTFRSTAPGCNSTNSLCAIQILASPTHNIDDTKFADLQDESSDLSAPGTYVSGVIRFKQ